MTWWVALHTYWGYSRLVLRGVLLDTWDLSKSILLGQATARDAKGTDGLALDFIVTSDERHLPLLSGWVDFYTRRLYRRIEDVFNRPVKGPVGSWMDVMIREWKDSRLQPNG